MSCCAHGSSHGSEALGGDFGALGQTGSTGERRAWPRRVVAVPVLSPAQLVPTQPVMFNPAPTAAQIPSLPQRADVSRQAAGRRAPEATRCLWLPCMTQGTRSHLIGFCSELSFPQSAKVTAERATGSGSACRCLRMLPGCCERARSLGSCQAVPPLLQGTATGLLQGETPMVML